MPHLVDASPEYQTVKGLKPNLERGITFVDIEPVSKSFSASHDGLVLQSLLISCLRNNEKNSEE